MTRVPHFKIFLLARMLVRETIGVDSSDSSSQHFEMLSCMRSDDPYVVFERGVRARSANFIISLKYDCNHSRVREYFKHISQILRVLLILRNLNSHFALEHRYIPPQMLETSWLTRNTSLGCTNEKVYWHL